MTIELLLPMTVVLFLPEKETLKKGGHIV